MQLANTAVVVFNDVGQANDIRAHQTHLSVGTETVELRRRDLREIARFDI